MMNSFLGKCECGKEITIGSSSYIHPDYYETVVYIEIRHGREMMSNISEKKFMEPDVLYASKQLITAAMIKAKKHGDVGLMPEECFDFWYTVRMTLAGM